MPDYQLSLAIGKSGQNVRLAAKLCGWKIDIKSHTQYYDGEEEEITDLPEEEVADPPEEAIEEGKEVEATEEAEKTEEEIVEIEE